MVLLLLLGGLAAATPAPRFNRFCIVMLENADFQDAVKQPFLAGLARQGALLTNYHAIGHPSQPNYLALTSGSAHDVHSDGTVTLDCRHIGNLLEAHGRTWKEYVEDLPAPCWLGAYHGLYARKHAPFISYRNVQSNPAECARVVDATQLDRDLSQHQLPDYLFYVPNQGNDGHNTGVAFADNWLARRFGPLLHNPEFMRGMLFVVTFDEDDHFFVDLSANHVYAVLVGAGVRPGARSNVRYTHYGLLRTLEDAWGLGSLGLEDTKAKPITDVWK
ncbi:MAG: alkaline phosphatase family protein [Candidatus Xenobia bacterium]